MGLNVVRTIDGAVRVQNVLVSVSDKSGLDVLASALLAINPSVKLYSTGGTFSCLAELLGSAAGEHLLPVSEYTGQPEMQGGLVKTLDFKIYLGLLSETYNAAHVRDLQRTQAVAFDMVVVNLYPFRATIAADGVTVEQARTNIDIGGPCMVRASAKNFLRVASVTDPQDYEAVLGELRKFDGCLSLSTRFELAKKAFAHTADYDRAIADYLAGKEAKDVAGCYTVNG